jgi:hypothetical protein
MRALRDTRGQTVVLSVVFMSAVVGMAAFVLDVGSWYRADRAAQATADAAVLAGAQALPDDDPGEAYAQVLDYADRNGGGLDPGEVTFSSHFVANDTVSVDIERDAPGFFAKLFGIDSVDVAAKASARAGAMGSAKWVAPVVVNINHPLMPGGQGCDPLSCDPVFDSPTELELAHLHKPGSGDAAGAFGLINLKLGSSGSVGASELADWMLKGFSEAMPLGKYKSVPSSMFNSSHFREALSARLNTEVMIPIYDEIKKSGSTAEYNIIGWVGFVPTAFTGGGDNGKLHGHFTQVVWQGIPATSASQPAFGAQTISLVD